MLKAVFNWSRRSSWVGWIWLLLSGVQAVWCSAQSSGPGPAGYGDGLFHPGTNGYALRAASQVQDLNYQQDFSAEVAVNIEAHAAGGCWPTLLGKKNFPSLADPGFALSIPQGQYQTVGQQLHATVADGVQQAALSSRAFQGTAHAVLSWNVTSKELRLYVNGGLEGRVTNALLKAANLRNNADLKLAAPSFGQPLQRDVLLARLWNRCLSPGEVTALWTHFNHTGQPGTPGGFDRSGLLSEWLMQELSPAGHLKDSQGSNHLQLRGTAELWLANGPLVAMYPPNNASNVSKSVVLKVGGGLASLGGTALRPLHYEFQIDETNTFDSPALKRSGWRAGYGTWKPVLKPLMRYFWRVRAQDAAGRPVSPEFMMTNCFTTRSAADWYVRPGVYTRGQDPVTFAPVPQTGLYGRQDGTSYAAAWNGLPSVVWGEGSVEPGDTLWICGAHYWVQGGTGFYITHYVTESGYSDEFPITIRADYTNDPGTLWGCSGRTYAAKAAWSGPDVNGVYSTSNADYACDFCLVGGTNLVLLKRQAAPTWSNDNGASYTTNGVWYVKTPDGTSPAGKLFRAYFGYRFDLGRSSYIRFFRCRFYNAAPTMDQAFSDPQWDTQTPLPLSCHITFDGCDLRYGSELTLTPGNNYWTVRNSELSCGPYGVYTVLNQRPYGADYLTVSNCYIHDMPVAQFPNLDGHAVGVQGGTGHWIQGNRIENTGPAIVFWTGNAPMRNHTICHNFVNNVKLVWPDGGADGIAVAGDNATMRPGMTTGFRIFGNIVANPGVGTTQSWQGNGISSSVPDFIEIYNNVVYNANKGIWLSVVAGEPQGKICNNIICNARDYCLWIHGTRGRIGNLFIDYNLFYPVPDLSSKFLVSPRASHDQHSIFADPLFVSTSPAKAEDFRLRAGSRAIGAGIPVGLPRDFAGNPIATSRPPDIGAYQRTGPTAPTGLRK